MEQNCIASVYLENIRVSVLHYPIVITLGTLSMAGFRDSTTWRSFLAAYPKQQSFNIIYQRRVKKSPSKRVVTT